MISDYTAFTKKRLNRRVQMTIMMLSLSNSPIKALKLEAMIRLVEENRLDKLVVPHC